MKNRSLTFDEIYSYRRTVVNTFIPIIDEVRKEIAETHDVESKDSDFYRYTGLCDYASSMIVSKINSLNEDRNNPDFIAGTVHGEQKHSPRIESKYWAEQHTWVAVLLCRLNCFIFIDPTSSQFKRLYSDIPDIYISMRPPKWFYPDRKNPLWNGITGKINESIKFPFKHGDFIVHDGLIEILQYRVWGNISDLLRKIFN